MILLLNFFRNVPKELEEVAFVDGAGYFRTLILVLLPVSMPADTGITIIPLNGTIISPVNSVVTTITKSRHAIEIISNDGVEVLIYVGLDTVKMKGEGFSLKVLR
ncbi:PTS glucose transporter subunit IIA [Paenibacillus pabuli]|uniref:Phosphoenolpyruvate-dependent sugar phosphotransferase system EIIA component n=1 Tax=Paenibacillus pabuli TaxID=1472 RepID=A0A855XLY6_9BACL|nr:PTS glucose transporter subunit IIA [Paenibacillus pabuli]PWW34308.1 phosphoenolpyruvate-dependent sugar phosphotransferase system EIIA component [Paenibacillus pabuli]PXW00729.1 phosphoenolpyruvate-dependent sugar phosphotransferase system EIIA component [Paenibacillus taichungensis]